MFPLLLGDENPLNIFRVRKGDVKIKIMKNFI